MKTLCQYDNHCHVLHYIAIYSTLYYYNRKLGFNTRFLTLGLFNIGFIILKFDIGLILYNIDLRVYTIYCRTYNINPRVYNSRD